MKKSISFFLTAVAAAALIQTPALASSKSTGQDPYTASMQSYAKENPALAPSLQSYQKELESVMKKKPELNEGTAKSAQAE